MLAETFRADPGRTGRLKDLLNDPTMALALVVLKDEAQVSDVPMLSDPTASVRHLSKLSGSNDTINLLLSLAEPLPVETPEPEPTWGINKEEFAGV